ncbi:Acetylxylan esterase [Pontiella desulfatans]|uniref:Acetylxylan esterase n=1 Tax=Pontiella desulfatans TaxID=2750659 RepID=A0A6C2UA11_PONDE|nr:alpha/beta hydrolase [Pontiella desulfatans]VGO16224.1 Acetylxylan esterase [Pontiella desulfatans]
MKKKYLIGVLLCSALSVQAEVEMKSILDFAEHDARPVETNIYKRVEDRDLRLLVCRPDGWEPGQQCAAMVWIHGGGWVAGGPEDFLPHLRYSAARGAVGFSVQYRLLNKEKDGSGPVISDCIADCEDAVRYIRHHAQELGIDPQRISVIGDSAGGHLASCLGTGATGEARADAVVDCNGITDMGFENWSTYIRPGADRDERIMKASPLFNITMPSPPFLVLQGKRDATVKPEMAEAFYSALKTAGADCEYKLYPGAQHAFIVYGYSATLEEITQAILDLDDFLLHRGLLDGPTSICMPDYPETDAVIESVEDPFSGSKTIVRPAGFPGFMTIQLEVKPARKFSGQLFALTGRFGCSLKVSNGGQDFKALRMRLRGKELLLQPEQWQTVTVSLGRDKVVIRTQSQAVEIANEFRHAFLSNELVLGAGLDAEIRNVKIVGRPGGGGKQ